MFNKFIVGCLFMTATAAFSASFDCGKAKSPVEK